MRFYHLESEGLSIGLFPNSEYEERHCSLLPGDLLIAYTDGIMETSNRKRELWGLRGLEGALSTCVGRPTQEVIAAVLKAQQEFAGPIAPSDDMTLIIANIEEAASSELAERAHVSATCRDESTRYGAP
ncbi:MAG: rsbU 2 [Bryobacterales bacterium]|nr:rsbU 2 [Bryobacterales bacterium]